MKRYIITIKEFEGVQIKRFDGYFKSPFLTREEFTEDPDGWTIKTRTSTHLELLLRNMEKQGKADRVVTGNRFHRVWIVDVIDGLAIGQYWPYAERPMNHSKAQLRVIK